MSQQTIKAIETQYKGYRFRSRLEARWAVFFDKLGIAWEYEKEGYDLGAAGWYLPDFWLPEQECWIEIKPDTSYLVKGNYIQGATLAQGSKKDFYVFEGGEFAPLRFDPSATDRRDITGTIGRWFPPYEYDDDPQEWVKRGGENQYEDWGICGTFEQCNKCKFVAPGYAHVWDWHVKKSGHFRTVDRDGQEAYRIADASPYSARLLAAYAAARSARFEHGERP